MHLLFPLKTSLVIVLSVLDDVTHCTNKSASQSVVLKSSGFILSAF